MSDKNAGLEAILQDHFGAIKDTLDESPFGDIAEVASVLLEARAKGNWIFSAGNGGSSSTASHIVNDFIKNLSVDGKKRFKMFSLTDNISLLTALSNDYDYSLCFLEQLKNYGKAGDVLLVFSGSGSSANVVKAAGYARQIGMKVIAFTGCGGGKIDEFCHINCIAPIDNMEQIEDVHMVWGHALIYGLKDAIINE